MKQVVACLIKALAGGGVGGERQAGSRGGAAFRGGAAVCDDGGRLGESRGGRFRVLLPEAEGASACVCARVTSQRGTGGGRRARTLTGPAVRKEAIREGLWCNSVAMVLRCVWFCHFEKMDSGTRRLRNPQTGRV